MIGEISPTRRACSVEPLEQRFLFFVQAFFVEVPISPAAIAAAPELEDYRSYDVIARVSTGDKFAVAGIKSDLTSGQLYNATEGSIFARPELWSIFPHVEFDSWVDAPGTSLMASPGRYVTPGPAYVDSTGMNISWGRNGQERGTHGDFTVARLTVSTGATGTIDGVFFGQRKSNEGTKFRFTFGAERRPPVVSQTISGRVFVDSDADGRPDDNGATLSNRTVWIDLNNDNKIDAAEPMTRTDAAGEYRFDGVWVGDYRIRARVPDHWRRTLPSAGSYNVRIDGPDLFPVRNFAMTERGFLNISGRVVADHNDDGVADGAPFAGRTVWIDSNRDGRLDAGERTAITAADGSFLIKNLPEGDHRVRVRVPDGWRRSHPGRGWYEVTSVGPEIQNITRDFMLTLQNRVQLSVFHDLDGDGLRSPNEPGVNVRDILIDSNHNGVVDPGETLVKLPSTGLVDLRLPPGRYSFVLLNDPRLIHTTPAAQSSVLSGVDGPILFGVRRIR